MSAGALKGDEYMDCEARIRGEVLCKNEEWLGIIVAGGVEHFFAMFDCGVDVYLNHIEKGVRVTFQLVKNKHGTPLVQDVKIDSSLHRLVLRTGSNFNRLL